MRLLSLVTAVAGCGLIGVLGQDAPQCNASLGSRLDCHPESGANEGRCRARGCCWTPTTPEDSSLLRSGHVPFCFYPADYPGYEVVNQTRTASGASVFLRRSFPSNVDADVGLVRVDVVQQTEDILRITVVDASASRWQPPLPTPPAPAAAENYSYSFTLDNSASLQVFRWDGKRASTRVASFDLASMIFTDRFLQIRNTLPSDVVYGLGEHKGKLRRSMNYTRLTFYNEDRAPEYDARLYGTHPFYINIEADGRANGVWLLNSNAQDIILTPAPSVVYRPVGGVLDFFVFMGPTPTQVVKQYQQMVGKPKMVPYWALGFHLCRFGYRSTEHTRKTLQRNLDAGIRVDVQWNDIDYMDERNGFTIDPVNYKDLGTFVRQLHKDGRHYVLIVDPAVSGSEKQGEYPPFDRGIDYDVFVKDSNGEVVYAKVWNLKSSVFPDFTHPNASAYWTELFRDFHNEVPFDGAWIDMNEPANMINGHMDEGCPADAQLVYTPGDEPLQTKTLCNTDRQHWSEHYDVHNMYGFTEAIATYDAMQTVRPNARPFIISRSTFSGQGFYSGHWTGDIWSSWTDLRDSVPGILEFSFYGVPLVGADICGFNGNTTVDLCARWQALGAFYPFSRNHNTDEALDQDPASMGDAVVVPTRNAYYWRYKLLPYLYTLFYRAHRYGETVARPLFFDHPTDVETFDNDEQFMWGSALMVVPALHENQTTIEAYFPRGTWYDLQNRTETVHATEAGLRRTLPAYNDTINFFMKGGNAVFFQEPGATTTESRRNPFGVYVFLDEKNSAEGELFLDDGESIDSIEEGRYQIVRVHASDRMFVLSATDGDFPPHALDTVHVFGVKQKPKYVTVSMDDFSDFTYDADRHLLTLHNLGATTSFVSAIFYY